MEVSLIDEPDQSISIFSSTGKFSVQSLYEVINNHGVKPVFVHVVWKLGIPPSRPANGAKSTPNPPRSSGYQIVFLTQPSPKFEANNPPQSSPWKQVHPSVPACVACASASMFGSSMCRLRQCLHVRLIRCRRRRRCLRGSGHRS